MDLGARAPLLVLGLPFAAFLVLAVVAPLRRAGRAAGAVSILAAAVALVAALGVWRDGVRRTLTWAWIPADRGPMATVGLLVGPLSSALLVLVTPGSLLVPVHSLAY